MISAANLSPAADKMHDLDPVPVADDSFEPIGSADDFAVEFDGDALGGKRKMFEQVRQSQIRWHLSLLTVNTN